MAIQRFIATTFLFVIPHLVPFLRAESLVAFGFRQSAPDSMHVVQHGEFEAEVFHGAAVAEVSIRQLGEDWIDLCLWQQKFIRVKDIRRNAPAGGTALPGEL